MDWIWENNTKEIVAITYLDIELSENWLVKKMNKTENWVISFPAWLASRVSDILNNLDHFLEFTTLLWLDTIISKKLILYVSLIFNSAQVNPNINWVFATVELINGQKLFWELNLGWRLSIKQLIESKTFIPLIQSDINRILLINRDNIKTIQQKFD